jgi:hypothetical protein
LKKKIKFDFRFVWIVYAVGTLLAGLIWAQILAKSGAEWWIHFFTGASTLASLAGFHFIFLQLRDIKSEVQEKDRKGESQRFSQSLLTIMKYYSVQITNPDEIGIQTHVFFWSLIHDLVTAYLVLLGKIYII